MRVSADNLAHVLFGMYLAHDRTISDELRDEIADVEIVGADESRGGCGAASVSRSDRG